MTTFLFFLSQTVLVPIAICILKYKDVVRQFLPFFIYLLVKEMLEVISYVLIRAFHISNAPAYNILYLCESMLLTWQFSKLGCFGRTIKLYYGLQFLWVFLWITDIFYVGSLFQFNIVFHVCYCFILIFVAFLLVTRQVVRIRYSLLKNTAFIIGSAMIWWLSYNIVYEFVCFIANNSNVTEDTEAVTQFIGYAEAIMFLVSAWGIYCIPPRKDFSIAVSE